jgi:Tol biopolymer transport system component
MAKGQPYASERRFLEDPVTGAKITQVSGFPTINRKFYFHVNAFTPDSKTLVFHSYHSTERDSRIDIFKVNTDGTGLAQLTDSPGIGGAFLSHDGNWLYYMVGGEFRKVSMRTYEEETISRLEGLSGKAGLASMTLDDRSYFVEVVLTNGKVGIARFGTDGKEAAILYESDDITHVQCEPGEGKVVAFQHGPDEEHRNIWLIDADGSNLRPLELKYGNGHWMWLGSTGSIMSNLEKEYHGIAVMKEGDQAADHLVGGEHFWHGACSMDGKWMVSDTNWPDHGIQLINVATRKYKTLCYSGSSACHPSWTHPHPSFSPDGKLVVYNSDVSGIPHVYIAAIPEEMLAELSE